MRPLLLLLAAALSGCAADIAQSGFEETAALTAGQVGAQPVWLRTDADIVLVRKRLDTLLGQPLDADRAVEVALINNRGLQASYAELGIGAAELAAASRPPNPSFSLRRVSGGGVDLERQFMVDVVGMLTFPLARNAEARRFERTKVGAAHEALRVAAQTRRAFFAAVAARQTAAFIAQVRDAASAQAELAQRLNSVGNLPLIDFAREQAFYADAATRVARAEQTATTERERLVRLMGLWGDDLGFALPDRLPDLPAAAAPAEDIEAKAVEQRLDIRMARADVDALGRSLGLTRATRFVNVLEAGPAWTRGAGEPPRTGFEITLEVPLFDFGDARVAKAENTYLGSVNRLAQIAVNARSDVRESYARYRTALDVARHYQTEIVPLRKRISEEMTLRYNGMLASVFELLADAREQIAAVVEAIEAQRDFWLADTDLKFALLGEARAEN